MRRLIILLALFCAIPGPVTAGAIDDLRALVAGKKFTSAIEAGESLLKQKPQWPDVQFLTAYSYQMNRQTARATDLYQNLIRQHPELPEPRNNLAMIYLANGDYDAASKLLVEALNTHNSYATAYQNLSQIYTGIASEAYRRALSESAEPAKYTHKIELAALTQLEPPEQQNTTVTLASTEPEQSTNSILSQQIELWARAWSNKDFATYTSFYSTEHRPNFQTHSDWVEHRRQRIMRPGFIKIGVSDINVRAENNNRAIIDFKQSFDSPSYSDRVKKRLSFRRIGSQWKITDERVLSVL
ncbi:MAG: tetratricopeptide repeat protein [Gammaproteobacteria bacterium]|nr:tetratricopeptide repeat protein [Gammaproteobacteria bacterium]